MRRINVAKNDPYLQDVSPGTKCRVVVEVFDVRPLQTLPVHIPRPGKLIDRTVSSNTSNSNDAAPIEAARIAPGRDWFGVDLDPVLLWVDVRLTRAKDKDRVVIGPARVSGWATVFKVMCHGHLSGWSVALTTTIFEFPLGHFLEGFPAAGNRPGLLRLHRPNVAPSVSKLVDVELLVGVRMA
eukprot:8463026-Pyramimonas_sp.AAC.1